MSFDERLATGLARRRAQDLYRRRVTLESSQGASVTLGGRRYLNFCSNDYLGLAAHPEVVDALREGARQWGAGSGASHLVCGHSAVHEELEQALAELTDRPRALLFSTGYMANIGVQGALLQSGDRVLQDRLNHASLLDGGRFSGARFARFRHTDTADLARRLARPVDGETLVVTDGVFSMDGDSAPLAQLAALCREHGAWLMVDDAHGFGVAGKDGAGSVAAAGLSCAEVPVYMATQGKALGTFGAFVAGSESLIEALIQSARTYIYTTALPPAVAAATLTAVRLLGREPWRRTHLAELIGQFRNGAAARDLPVMPSQTAIQPLLIGDSAAALRCSASLRERGFLVTAIRPPTVPAGSARLRVTLSAAHSFDQVEQLLDALRQALSGE